MSRNRKRIAVIGLGQFGSELARALAGRCEVLALDRDDGKVNDISDAVQLALRLDARDEEALRTVVTGEFDEAVVCLGESMEAGILCTLHLRKIGVPLIRVKAVNDDQAEILRMVGATHVTFPERETARHMASRIVHPNLLDFVPLAENYRVMEVAPPPWFLDRTLLELHLRKRAGVLVIGARKAAGGPLVFLPGPDYKVEAGDALLMIGPDDALARFHDEAPPGKGTGG